MIQAQISTSGKQAVEEAMRRLAERLKKGDTQVLVGVPTGSGSYEDGLTIATIAAVNEFGSADGKIPARPFLHPAIAEGAPMFKRIAELRLPDVIAGKDNLLKALHQMGTLGVSLVQQKITDTYTPPNAESTIKAKGSSHPLIDTGALRQSIDYLVIHSDTEIVEGLQ